MKKVRKLSVTIVTIFSILSLFMYQKYNEVVEEISVPAERIHNHSQDTSLLVLFAGQEDGRIEAAVRDIKDCVPHYDQLLRHKQLRTGNRGWKATSLSLIAAYDYGTYSVVTIEADGWFGRTMYCRYFDESGVETYPAIESFVFPEFAVHCCSRNDTKLMSTTEYPSANITEIVRVLDRRVDEPVHFLSMCLAPIYGKERKWLVLVELIEYYKLQGVDHFYLYIKDIDNYTAKLIHYYEKSNIAEVVFFRTYNDRPGKEWQLVGTEDCLQRSRHHSRFVIFQDLDERIFPFGKETVRSLIIDKMPPRSPIAMLSISSRRVERAYALPLEYNGSETLMLYLPILNFHKSHLRNWIIFPPKCVVDPRKVLLMWVHKVEIYFPGYRGISLPASKAVIRHYRDLTYAEPARRRKFYNEWFKYGDVHYPSKLMIALYRNVYYTLNGVYGAMDYLEDFEEDIATIR